MGKGNTLVGFALLGASLCACSGPDIPATTSWPDGTHIVAGDAPLAYITNNGDDTISVISLSSFTVVATVPVGLDIVEPEAPHHLATDTINGFVYVGLSNIETAGPHSGIHGNHGTGVLPSYVQRLRIDDLSPDGETRVDSNLGDVILFDDHRLITTHFDLQRATEAATMGLPPEMGWASLTLVDGATMRKTGSVPICTAPHGVVVTQDQRTALAACYGDDSIAVVDVSGEVPVRTALVPVGPLARSTPPPHYGPYSIVLAPDGERAFVGNTDTHDVRVFHIDTQSIGDDDAIPLSGAAFFGAFSADGSRFYVPTQIEDAIAIIDTATLAVIQTRVLDASECVSPHVAVLDPATPRLLLVCEGDHMLPGTVLALDLENLETLGVIDVGIYPDAVQIVNEVTW